MTKAFRLVLKIPVYLHQKINIILVNRTCINCLQKNIRSCVTFLSLYKKVLFLLIEPLCFLNKFLLLSIPMKLKIGRVIPINKNYRQNLDNYGSVTLPSVFSKSFEYRFLERLLIYFENYYNMSSIQHGFCSGRGTTNGMHRYILFTNFETV